ncbi:DUF6894 family protein [Microvirga rosea]|uniref:DUF6894 family protein n=1 Tax=Microvirga rosea TaxID=2715425 RepID=UPI001D0AB23D|nr:hypothetical protein [Microvirga rosea]MCB8821057.1 hypothetical protein [Microvirga rosea]
MLVFAVRYFFNLTNGQDAIRDEEGMEVSDVQSALASAMEAIEELRAADPSYSQDWRGWNLEVVDAAGRLIQRFPLVDSAAH